MAQENAALRIASSVLLLLNVLQIFNAMTFSGAVFFSTIFSFLNSKSHRPCQFLYYSE